MRGSVAGLRSICTRRKCPLVLVRRILYAKYRPGESALGVLRNSKVHSDRICHSRHLWSAVSRPLTESCSVVK